MKTADSHPRVNDTVRLTHDLPHSELHQGDIGVVCSKWFAPRAAYEVEFRPLEQDVPLRTIVVDEQLVVEEDDRAEVLTEAAARP